MNPIFIFCIICVGILLWFVFAYTFPWIGMLAGKIWKDTKGLINEKEEEDKEDEEEW